MSQFKKNPEFVDKVCNTCKNTYQISFYKRKTSVYCSKKCANANEDVLTKMRTSQKKTYDEKYNGLHPMQTVFQTSWKQSSAGDHRRNDLLEWHPLCSGVKCWIHSLCQKTCQLNWSHTDK